MASDTRIADPVANELALLRAVAAKDEIAFERIYKRYYHRVMQFVSRMLRDRRLAEEVVDDTMFAVWKGAAGFQGRSSVSTWILGIAYRRALKTIESNKRHSYFDSDSARIDYTADDNFDGDPESVVTAADLREHVDHAIGSLSEAHRTVMLLTLMGYNYEEISDIVDCPANTVKTRMFYARKSLKSMLSEKTLLTMTDKRQPNTWQHRSQMS